MTWALVAGTVADMEMTRAHSLAVKARASAGVDSSKLRGSAATQVQEEGVMLVEKYHQPLAYLSSVEVFDELLNGAERYVQLRNALPLALRMMAAATRAGVPSDAAVDAMLLNSGGGEELGLVGLAALLDAALEERDAATLAEERLAQPVEGDMSLDDFAAELGIDIAQVRAEVASGTPRATYDR